MGELGRAPHNDICVVLHLVKVFEVTAPRELIEHLFRFNQGVPRDPNSQHLCSFSRASIRDQLDIWEVEMLVSIPLHHLHQKGLLVRLGGHPDPVWLSEVLLDGGDQT